MKKSKLACIEDSQLFIGVRKLEFEMSSTPFNSICLRIKAWNCNNESKDHNLLIVFDSAEYGHIEMKDVTPPPGDDKLEPIVQSVLQELTEEEGR